MAKCTRATDNHFKQYFHFYDIFEPRAACDLSLRGHSSLKEYQPRETCMPETLPLIDLDTSTINLMKSCSSENTVETDRMWILPLTWNLNNYSRQKSLEQNSSLIGTASLIWLVLGLFTALLLLSQRMELLLNGTHSPGGSRFRLIRAYWILFTPPFCRFHTSKDSMGGSTNGCNHTHAGIKQHALLLKYK